MALNKQEVLDLMVEEKQIAVTLDNALAARTKAVADAEQAYVAAITAAGDQHVAATQKAESRLVEIRATIKRDGEWIDPKTVRP